MRSFLALSAFMAAWPASLSSAFFLFHCMNNSVVIGVVVFVFLRCKTNTSRQYVITMLNKSNYRTEIVESRTSQFQRMMPTTLHIPDLQSHLQWLFYHSLPPVRPSFGILAHIPVEGHACSGNLYHHLGKPKTIHTVSSPRHQESTCRPAQNKQITKNVFLFNNRLQTE